MTAVDPGTCRGFAKEKIVRWCCHGLEVAFDNAGLRGLALVVDKLPSNEPMFMLQLRSVDAAEMATVQVAGPVKVDLVADVPISFCPWCGALLRTHYRDWESMVRPGLALTESP